jgi:hypothetical protein
MRSYILVALLLAASPALAQDSGEVFSGDVGGVMQHNASGFTCPLKIGSFERDAVGQRTPEIGADYCAYSALSGVYGTIVIMPLPRTYDPKAILAPEFAIQDGSGGRMIDETQQGIGAKDAKLPVFVRTYETTRVESLHYRMLFASAAVGAWSVQVILEYAWPRDKDMQAAFLANAYGMALKEIGAPQAKP